jgi:hypothetical protein
MEVIVMSKNTQIYHIFHECPHCPLFFKDDKLLKLHLEIDHKK